MSASSKTMTGALPPSSRCVRLMVGDGGLKHFLAGADAARQRDHRDLRMIDEGGSRGRTLADDDVHDAFGEDVGNNLAELQERQRRLLGGASGRWCCHLRARGRASRPPSSADNSRARSSRRHRWDRGGSSRYGPEDIRPRRVRACCGRRRRSSGSNRRWPASRPAARGCAACRCSKLRVRRRLQRPSQSRPRASGAASSVRRASSATTS